MQHYYTDADIMQVGQTCREGTTPVYEGWDWRKQRDHPLTVRDQYGTACAEPDNEATCPIARYCIHPNFCYPDTPNWMEIDVLVQYLGLGRLRQFADDTSCNAYFGNNRAAEAMAMAQNGVDGQVITPCTFNTHSITLFPSTAGAQANWPYLDQEYLDRYTQVEWATEGRAQPPPPLPPPPAYVRLVG